MCPPGYDGSRYFAAKLERQCECAAPLPARRVPYHQVWCAEAAIPSRCIARTVTIYYALTDESDATVTVMVESEDLRHARVTSDLDELGVPESEQAGVRERAIEAYWSAEHAAWLQTPAGEGA